MATIMYEGLPIRPDPGIWWKIVQDHKVTVMFSRADRDPRAEEAGSGVSHEVRHQSRCGTCSWPASRSTSRPRSWIADALGVPIIDHYWQTETGWPILTGVPGVEKTPTKFGSPCFPAYGYDLKLLHEAHRARRWARTKRAWSASCRRCRRAACRRCGARTSVSCRPTSRSFKDRMIYTTFDWGIRDDDGYYFILGRTDDVINVAGHRLGTREIEEAVSGHPDIAEVAVVGVADQLKGQVPLAFAVVKDRGPNRHAARLRSAWRRKSWRPSTRRSAPSAGPAACTS